MAKKKDLPAKKDVVELMSERVDKISEALYQHAVSEAERLPEIAQLLKEVENRIIEKESLDKLNPLQLMKLYKLVRDATRDSTEFLEKMMTLSMKLNLILALRKQLQAEAVSVSKEPEIDLELDDPALKEQVKDILIKLIK